MERERVLAIVRERYGGETQKGAGQRFGPTLAAEQLEEDEGLVIPVSTLREMDDREPALDQAEKMAAEI